MPSGFSQEAEQIRDLTSGESQAGWPPPNMKTEGGSGQNVESEDTPGNLEKEEALGGPMFCPPLYKQRYAAVANVIQDKQCKKLVDFGCSECKFMVFLRELPNLESVTLVDVDRRVLMDHRYMIHPRASDFLMNTRKQDLQVQLYEGSVTEHDSRLDGTDVVTMIEVIEHLEDDVLEAFPSMLFGKLKPQMIIMTTPNQEFNVLFENFSGFRHPDHKFEWTRQEFQDWCSRMCSSYGYSVVYQGIGDPPAGREDVGCCSQMAVFTRCEEMTEKSTAEATEIQPYSMVASSVFPSRNICGTPEEHTQQQAEYHLRTLAHSRWEDYDARMQQMDDLENDLDAKVTSLEVSNGPSHVDNHVSETQEGDSGTSSLYDSWGAKFGSPAEAVNTDQDYFDESSDIFYVHVTLTYLWSCRQVRETCDTLDTLSEILTKAGYQFTPDGLSLIYAYHLSEPSLSDGDMDEGCGASESNDSCHSNDGSCHNDWNTAGGDNQENWESDNGSDWECDNDKNTGKLKLTDDKGYTFNVYIQDLHKPECAIQTNSGECNCEFSGIENDLQRMTMKDINWEPVVNVVSVPEKPRCCCLDNYPPTMADISQGRICEVHVKTIAYRHLVEESQFSDAEDT